ncbi:MAG: sigma-54-dependent Fis family transcriptional regulator [Planctomycetes bacterium]|nr:sigma-54-dependent Fis family transcriptional regulator [Planctomycetota bacterium]
MADAERWKVLLVDDDRHSRAALADWLTSEGLDVLVAEDGQVAQRHLHDGVAVIVTDLKMPRTDGLELLRLAKEEAPHAAVILITAYGTVDSAVTALKEGAYDYMTKPVNPEQLSLRIRQAVSQRTMAAEIASLQAQLQQQYGIGNLIGKSPAMRAVFEKIRLVAETRSTVLITGESGTGKELVARALHQNSSRRSKPFIPVNCAAISGTLIESEFFGHEKGAFTGATERRQGLVQAAHGGTLFIDEIGEMELGLQSKLLRALENRRIMPVGSSREVEVDVRLIAATNRDLDEQLKNGKFREDLYYRLKVVEIKLPPLRDRPEDIPLLARFFIDQITSENQRPVRDILPEALDLLRAYSWPGNVRELRNALEGIIVLSTRQRIDVSDLPEHTRGAAAAQVAIRPGMTMSEIEKEAIRRALEQTGGNRTLAAKMLDLSVRTLQRKIKEYSLPF